MVLDPNLVVLMRGGLFHRAVPRKPVLQVFDRVDLWGMLPWYIPYLVSVPFPAREIVYAMLVLTCNDLYNQVTGQGSRVP